MPINLVSVPQLVQRCEVSALAFESSKGLRYIVNADTLYIDGNLVFIPQVVQRSEVSALVFGSSEGLRTTFLMLIPFTSMVI